MAKRGQYFTIDAFVAMLVVATGLILVFAVNSSRLSSSQPELLSQEFVNTLAQTKIKEVNNPFVTQQVRSGNITDFDNTILQQAYEFKRYFSTNMSAEFLANLTPSLVPRQYSFEIRIDDEHIYGRGEGQDTTNLLISSKRLVFGVVNKSAEFWGPATVEVRVWQ